MSKSRVKKKDPSEGPLAKIAKQIQTQLGKLHEIRQGRDCYSFLGVTITRAVVDDVFEELRSGHKDCSGHLDVLVDSGGGDIDAAYNLGALFRKFAPEDLTFIVPRWAKSAATLLACSGKRILMSPVAELGPLDPQITEYNPLERRLEQVSPLNIDSTLQLIREEFQKGSKQLAQGLIERLQFPLTLGGFKKSIDIGKQYLQKLLATGMFAGADGAREKAGEVASKLSEGYADHGFCINLEEARDIGLIVEEIPDKDLEAVWSIYKLHRQKESIRRERDRERAEEMMKKLPPGVAEKLLGSGGSTGPRPEGPEDSR